MNITKGADVVVDFIKNSFVKLCDFFAEIKEKIGSLESVNYSILLKNIRRFNIDEVVRRTQIMRMLWPNNVDVAVFMCLIHMIDDDKDKAMEIIKKFKEKDKKNIFNVFESMINDNRIKEIQTKFFDGDNLIKIRQFYEEKIN